MVVEHRGETNDDDDEKHGEMAWRKCDKNVSSIVIPKPPKQTPEPKPKQAKL